MSEDPRLPGLPAEVQQLLNAERRGMTPPPGARDRVKARVGVTLGLAAAATATGAATTAQAASTAQGLGAFFTAKVLAPLGLGALVLGAVVVPQVMKRNAPAPVAAPAEKVAPVAVPVVEPAVVVEPAAPVVDEKPAPRTARANSKGLAQERRALDEARNLINHGSPSQGLTALGRHEKDFPRGQLAEERDALRVMALAQLGRTREARDAARVFSRRHPGSVLQSAVDAALTSPQ